MPPPKTLPHDMPLLAVRRHLTHTRRSLLAQPALASFAAGYDTLLVSWDKVSKQDLDLQDQVDAVAALQRSLDSGLNQYARRLWKEIGLLTGDDPEAPLRKLYFGNKMLHAFIRPILAGQLAATHTWIDPLAKSGNKEMEAIGQALVPLLAQADASVVAQGQAVKARDEFRLIGGRKLFLDEVNNARKQTYADAVKLQTKHPELTSEIVEGLFRRDRARDEDPTLEGLDEEIAELEAELESKKKLRAKLEKDQEDAEAQKKQAEIALKKQQLGDAQQDLEAMQKKILKLMAEIEDDAPGGGDDPTGK